MKFYLVGGAVRDRLLGLPVKDRDWVVVGGTAAELRAQGFIAVGKDFPVFLHPETKEEYALARTERKVALGYHGFEFYASKEVTLEQDLARRDLTINAIAETPDGQLIDPYGGVDDLRNRVLKHVSAAFAEDPVRILRVARFAARLGARGFHVAHSTNILMRDMVRAGEVSALVPERVWAETQKSLSELEPVRYFEVLHDCGALVITFPEIDPWFAHSAAENSVVASLKIFAKLNRDPLERFAALQVALHLADPSEPVGAPIKRFCARLKAPNPYRDLAILCVRLTTLLHSTPRADTLVEILQHADAWRRPDTFHQALHVLTTLDSNRFSEWQHILTRALTASLRVDTSTLAASKLSGPEIAAQLKALRVAAVEQMLAESTGTV